jgi:hypothetical protein
MRSRAGCSWEVYVALAGVRGNPRKSSLRFEGRAARGLPGLSRRFASFLQRDLLHLLLLMGFGAAEFLAAFSTANGGGLNGGRGTSFQFLVFGFEFER